MSRANYENNPIRFWTASYFDDEPFWAGFDTGRVSSIGWLIPAVENSVYDKMKAWYLAKSLEEDPLHPNKDLENVKINVDETTSHDLVILDIGWTFDTVPDCLVDDGDDD